MKRLTTVCQLLLLSWAMLLVLFYGAPTLATEPYFMGLGIPVGLARSTALGISDDGQVVVGWIGGPDTIAMRWMKDDGIEDLGLPTLGRPAYAASADGSVIVGGNDGFQTANSQAFRWQNGDVTLLGNLPNHGAIAKGVSDDGNVVVGHGQYFFDNNTEQAWRWTSDGGMVGLGDLAGGISNSRASAVSADGSVVVGYGTSNLGQQAMRWTASSGMVGLGDLPGGEYLSEALAVSANGEVVVGYSSSAHAVHEAFRWTSSSGMTSLGDLGLNSGSEALAVSADGSVIVGTASLGGHALNSAMIWNANDGMRNLRDALIGEYGIDLNGWNYLTQATGISADGRTIVGYGRNPAGRTEGWVAFLGAVPEPSGIVLVALATIAMVRRPTAWGTYS